MISCVGATDTRNCILVGDGESISVTLTRFAYPVGCRRNSLKIHILSNQIKMQEYQLYPYLLCTIDNGTHRSS